MPDTPSTGAAPAPAHPSLQRLRIDRGAGAPARRRHRRWLPWAAVALLAAAAAFYAFGPRKHQVQVASVLTAYPTQQYAQLTASGYVVAQRRSAVASKATGRLVELLVREGSQVRQGEVLARLDASDVRASTLAAQAGVHQAEAGLRQAGAGVRQAQAEQANAQAEMQRTLALKEQGFVSPQAVDAARRRADAASAALSAAQASVAQAQASIGQARAQLKVQQVNEDFTEIRAPFDGVVLVKNANVGDIITPFSSAAGSQGAVVTMADMSTLEVEADVSESNVGKIRPDQPVEITLDALPEARFRGSVARIVPTVDRAKATVMTKIRFEKLDPRVLPEMSAKVNFLSQPATDADQKPVLAVNPKAIVERGGRKLVLRLAGDTLQEVPVTPGRKLGDAVEITGGVASGDKLVLAPVDSLKAGSRVEVAAK